MTGVLVTRPIPDAQGMMDAISAIGLTPFHAPMITITPLQDVSPPPDNVTALAITSANGVRAFRAFNTRRDLPVFAIGPVSAAAAREAGFDVVGVADNDVKSLARLIDRQITNRSSSLIYHPVGRVEAGDLVGVLAKGGICAQKEVLYDAQPVTDLPPAIIAQLKSGAIGWVTALSPRTALYLSEALEKAGLRALTAQLQAAVFSTAVATALRPGFLGPIYIANAPKISHLIDILAADIH